MSTTSTSETSSSRALTSASLYTKWKRPLLLGPNTFRVILNLMLSTDSSVCYAYCQEALMLKAPEATQSRTFYTVQSPILELLDHTSTGRPLFSAKASVMTLLMLSNTSKAPPPSKKRSRPQTPLSPLLQSTTEGLRRLRPTRASRSLIELQSGSDGLLFCGDPPEQAKHTLLTPISRPAILKKSRLSVLTIQVNGLMATTAIGESSLTNSELALVACLSKLSFDSLISIRSKSQSKEDLCAGILKSST